MMALGSFVGAVPASLLVMYKSRPTRVQIKSAIDLDVSDTVDDYLVGVGADIAVGKNMGLRVAVDTVSFDTLRPSVGLHLKF
jgi:hypothetical protein